MNKKIALVRLLEASFVLNDEERFALLEAVPSMNEKQVQAMGTFLATERQFILEHERDMRMNLDKLFKKVEENNKENVYVGVGKPQ